VTQLVQLQMAKSKIYFYPFDVFPFHNYDNKQSVE